jgi:hypothetical protein
LGRRRRGCGRTGLAAALVAFGEMLWRVVDWLSQRMVCRVDFPYFIRYR